MTISTWKGLREYDPCPEELIEGLGYEKPPVEIVRVCDAFGVPCHYVDNVKWISAVDANVNSGKAEILVHTHLEKFHRRARFAVARELTRLIKDDLDEEGNIHRRDYNFVPTNDHELELNNYASELLMPKFLVDIAQRYRRWSLFGSEPMHKYFNVTKDRYERRMRKNE